MKVNFMSFSFGELRWKYALLLEKTGRWSLICILIPFLLALYWGLILQPQNIELREALNVMQQELNAPLPVHIQSGQESEPAAELTVTEYQQVKILFDIFSQYNIYVESGSYQFTSAKEGKEQSLKLIIPLRGEWVHLVKALQDISRALPVEVESLNISRNQTDVRGLSMTLQLFLYRGLQ